MSRRLPSISAFVAWGFGFLTSPMLRYIAAHRPRLRRFNALADRAGFQIRSTHYYEPTYRLADLPEDTASERVLPGLELREDAQLELLAQCRYQAELLEIPVEPAGPGSFGYRNGSYEFGDAEMLYNMIRLTKPRRLFEIGSGNSTLIARHAIDANRRDDVEYSCDHRCIEPYEMPWLEATGARIIRERVEDVQLTMFDELGPGDILFIDSSHVLRPRGDVLIEYQEIVPRLRPGVMIHAHDIFTPRDYPETWLREQRLLWNEQYLLESFLTFNDRYEIVSALNWLKHNHFEALAASCPMMRRHPQAEPGAMWFRRTT